MDAGADLVLGSHPHILQGIEIYKGKVICYSLCNFVNPEQLFPNYMTEEACETMILHCSLSKDGVDQVYFTPVFIDPVFQPYVLEPESDKFRKIVDIMKKLSSELGTKLEEEAGKVWVLKS